MLIRYVLLFCLFFIPASTAWSQTTDDRCRNYYEQLKEESLEMESRSPDEPCHYFYEQLKDIPHEQFDRESGDITFSWDGETYNGCEITLITNDSLLTDAPRLPRFTRGPDPVLEEQGWRYNLRYDADGPGSSMYGIEKGDTLCLIHYAQPAALEESGDIVQESVLTITLECREKEK